MKKYIKPILFVSGAIAIMAATFLFVPTDNMSGRFTSEKFFAEMEEGELDSVLVKIAAQYNQSLPIMVNLDTRLDSTIGINKQFRYNYTMVDYSADQLDIKYFTHSMRPKLLNSACNTRDMVVFMNHGVPITYAYYGIQGNKITEITVHPSDCKSLHTTPDQNT